MCQRLVFNEVAVFQPAKLLQETPALLFSCCFCDFFYMEHLEMTATGETE